MPFKPGQSGNPGGRPKIDREVIEACRAASPRAVARLIEWMDSDKPAASIAAINSLMDRAWGKPTQPISGDDERDPISVRDYSKLTKAERDTLRALAVKAAT